MSPDPAAPHDGGPLGAFIVGPGLLARGRPGGPLAGARLAVKDLFDVAGTRTGAGNPDFLAVAPVAAAHAPAVAALLEAGADVIGKTITDELAYSLAGTNVHYGTPDNPRAPGRIPGGSSSGSAAAVAGGAADLGLGTDTGGSIRVPASYCGIYGVRPTHGRISAKGVVALAPSYDTVGLLSSSPQLLRDGLAALLTGARGAWSARTARPAPRRLLVPLSLFALASAESAAELERHAAEAAGRLGLELERVDGPAGTVLERAHEVFRVLQPAEAWHEHGAFIEQRHPSFGPGIAMRFAHAATVDADRRRSAVAERARLAAVLADLLADDAVLCQPAAAGPAPPRSLAATDGAAVRAATLTLTALAGHAGAPVVVVPGATVDGLPVGLAFVGAPGEDERLAELVCRLEASGGP